MGKAGIYLRPRDKRQREKENRRRRLRQGVLWSRLLLGNAGLIWLVGRGFLHPLAGSCMVALLSARMGMELGKEEA